MGRSARPSDARQGHFLFPDAELAAISSAFTTNGSAGAALFDELGSQFLAYYGTARGIVRREVVRYNLARHLPQHSKGQRALDLGCGEGLDAIWLAGLGYTVTAIDPSERMLAAAEKQIAIAPKAVRSRVHLTQGDAQTFATYRHRYDLAICHGVIMYVDDPWQVICPLGEAIRPGGIVSILTKNALGVAFRSAADGDYDEARRLLESPNFSRGRLGVETKGHTPEQVANWLDKAGADSEAWYGVRVFSDPLGEQPPADDIQALVDLEFSASDRDPYRSSARLIQVIGRRRNASDDPDHPIADA